MKFRKAGVADILAYVLIFTLFSGFMIGMLFNNITQERRSMMIDVINQEAMVLQAKLNGYSTTDKYSYMYDGSGSRITSRGTMESIKNRAIEEAKVSITNKFLEPRYAAQLNLKSIDIQVTDGPNVKDVARVKITIKYTASFRSPFNKEDGSSGDSVGLMSVDITDTATRTIENPVRLKNL